ncbi:MAG: preprotein translocase subunit SecA, partial [Gemmatimonadetes bacterium]|nr:preprotein translocase subunit SecA [Gemmatimonadota bacterium]
MLKAALQALVGNHHKREAKRLQPLVDEINQVADTYASLSDEQLRAKTAEFKKQIEDASAELKAQIAALREEKRHSEEPSERERLSIEIGGLEADLKELVEETLEDLLPEAFAVVKDACRRLVGTEIIVTGQTLVWDMVPYDVQLIGGIALHHGKVAEMATGEGKTLVATMPLYLNALAGRGAHLVTVNTYLAQRDAQWMGTVFEFLGLTVGVIDLYDPGSPERQAAYGADITYGTNNEFGFDYLRDNMVHQLAQRVQHAYAYAIIDEVDSILIDEARTPLIISGPVGRDTSTPFKEYNSLVANLHKKQFKICNEMVGEAEKHLEAGEEFEAGEKLLAVRRGLPKHKKFMKMLADEPSLQTLVNKVEGDYMREKRLHDVDEMLFFAMDEKGHNVHLSDRGLDEMSPNDPEAFTVPDLSAEMGEIELDETLTVDEKREKIQGLEAEYAAKSQKIHVIHQLLKAYTLFHKDEKYIIGEGGEIVIVDEFTGRQMAGRRWSDGLHQAVEAKEGVEIRGETQTLATITIQNYFRMYDKLSGMTGTAETEEHEFHQIYNLDVLVIPTNRPIVRDDRNDLIFRTKREKFVAIMDEIERLHKMELPVLVGTTNVEVSETLSRMLKRRGVPHQVLNAKHHKSESEIVRDAGQPGGVTIATNMAGRGTDIKLGTGVTEKRTLGWLKQRGIDLDDVMPVDPVRAEKLKIKTDDDVLEEGGLQILGSERHDSRRIDRQLRGRAGRQGDPGASQFYLSLEDDLMRLFGSERIANVMDRWGAEEGEVITHGLVTKSIERAQKKVEGNNFEARKRLLDYDDVMNQQREVVYDLRLFALEGGEDLRGEIWEMIEGAARDAMAEYMPVTVVPEQWDLAGLRRRLILDSFLMVTQLPEENNPEHELEREEIEGWVISGLKDAFHRKLESLGEHSEQVTSFIMLSVIDDKWKDHLYDLDHLKAAIGFRGWGQKDPLVEYKQEAYDMFVDLLAELRKTVASYFYRAQFGPPQPRRRAPQALNYSGPTDSPGGNLAGRAQQAGRAAPAAGSGNRDELGMSARAGGVAAAAGPDPRRLATNRGEEAPKKPVSVDDGPGRNDACPCGSGKKYKKC